MAAEMIDDGYQALQRAQQDEPARHGMNRRSAERLHVDPGQPLCIDQETLAKFLIAGTLHDSAAASRLACEGMAPTDAVEVVERYPSGSDIMRVVKVRVVSPGRAPKIGYTIELAK